MKKDTLPNKMSELLEVGLKDYMKTARDKKTYEIEMGNWHERSTPKSKCSVCVAGAIMAQTLHIPPTITINSWDFEYTLCSKFAAINDLRRGKVRDAAIELDLTDEDNGYDRYWSLSRTIVQPSESHFKFKRDIKKLITDLKAASL